MSVKSEGEDEELQVSVRVESATGDEVGSVCLCR